MATTAQSLSRADPQFGPPSEPINIEEFITSSQRDNLFHPSNSAILAEYEQLSEEEKLAMLNQCSVSDLCDSVMEICNSTKLLATLYKENELNLQNFVEDSQESTSKSGNKKRKRDAPTMVQSVNDLRAQMDAEIDLECWPFKHDANVFVRTPKYTELNSLTKIKFSPVLQDAPPAISENTYEALLTITLYNRPWRGRGPVSPSSQHVFLSSQTLGDLFNAILCTSKEIPAEIRDEDDRIIGYTEETHPDQSCAMVIEGYIYGDGKGEKDYADKVLEHNSLSKRPADLTKAPTSTSNTQFRSLSLRINQPYWIIHQGSCEHFFVIDNIRLQHSRDFSHGYPLTTKIIPTQIDQCRACKIPAALSVANDIRLGESPCLLCSPCWRKMGEPNEDEGVVVIPLPRYRAGWY